PNFPSRYKSRIIQHTAERQFFESAGSGSRKLAGALGKWDPGMLLSGIVCALRRQGRQALRPGNPEYGMKFASDNAAAVAPAILEAMVQANQGFALAYGNDLLTEAVERRFCDLFEREVAVFL